MNAPEDIEPELVQRMAACIRELADQPFGLLAFHFDTPRRIEVSALAALLPDPVDPDLIEARKLAAVRGDAMDSRIIAGEFDGSEMVKYRLAGIKRGRELAEQVRP